MRRLILTFVVVFYTIGSFAQKALSEYKFVIVPEQFEFVNGVDPYQISSMTKFYLNKTGLKAFFNDEAPNATRCDGLFANLVKEKSMFKTRIYISLKDCNGNELYKTKTGVSSYKEWKISYQDALRKASKSLEELDIDAIVGEVNTNKPIDKVIAVSEKETPLEEKTVKVEIENSSAESTPTISETETKVIGSKKMIELHNAPPQKFSNYTNGDNTFLLRQTSSGYSFYKEVTTNDEGLELIGKIVLGDNNGIIFTSGTVSGDVLFDASKNMTLFSGETTVKYKYIN